MFELAFDLVLEAIKCLGWYIPIYIVLGFLGDMIREGIR